VASGWVSQRAPHQRAQASALYLFGYQLGSTVIGFGGGLLYGAYGWAGEVATVSMLLAVGVLVAVSLPSAPSKEVVRAS
jgi:YNFM family putative membrane transporter